MHNLDCRLQQKTSRNLWINHSTVLQKCLMTFVICMLSGMTATIAVAWGCAAWFDPISRSGASIRGYSHHPPEYENWKTWKFERTAALRMVSSWLYDDPEVWNIKRCYFEPSDPPSEPLVPDWAEFLHPLYGDPSRGRFKCVADARGWPLLSMWGGCKSRSPLVFLNGVQQPREIEAHSIRAIRFSWEDDPTQWNDFDSRLLPLAPIWPGFAVNTLFYAAIVWLLALAPVTARRIVRRKRGRCIKCGYDLRSDFSRGCPECGWRRKEEDAQQPA